MKIIDPGHEYLLDTLDGGDGAYLIFVKREGIGYPGNVGAHSGVIIQEVLRACIHRLFYVDAQIHHPINAMCIRLLRIVIWLLESRAAERHDRDFSGVEVDCVEVMPVGADGHLLL